MFQLPDEAIAEGIEVFDSVEGSAWRAGDFLREILDELEPMIDNIPDFEDVQELRSYVIRVITDAAKTNPGTARQCERVSRVWKPENRRIELSHSVHRLCIKNDEPDFEMADWASEKEATYREVIARKREIKGLVALWEMKIKNMVNNGYKALGENDLPIEERQLIYNFIVGLGDIEKLRNTITWNERTEDDTLGNS